MKKPCVEYTLGKGRENVVVLSILWIGFYLEGIFFTTKEHLVTA